MRKLLPLLLLLCFFSAPAMAEPVVGDSCTGYTPGSVMRSSGPALNGVLYFLSCTGGVWAALPMGAEPPDPCTSSAIGTACTNGSIYAGLSPDGNAPMYITAADSTTTYTWNNGTTSWTNPGIGYCTTPTGTPCVSGKTNTTALSALSDAGAPYRAAKYCDDLVAHGKSDWYLPALYEMFVLHTNKTALGMTASGYWSSSAIDEGDDLAFSLDWADETGTAADMKNASLRVRCARR